MRREIRFGGFGGQGIISAGMITGKAAAIYDEKNAVLIQSYGPEARGGACSAEVVIENNEIDYPQVTIPEIAVILSQEAYDKYGGDLKEGGTMILEEDLVNGVQEELMEVDYYRIPATQVAENLGNRIVANVIVLGFLVSITAILSRESMKKAILSSVPESTQDLNKKAFDEGIKRGEHLKQKVQISQ